MPNPITTHTITVSPPTIMLIQRDVDGPITYASINTTPDQAIDILRRSLIHLVASTYQVETVPLSAAIVAPSTAPLNGHSEQIRTAKAKPKTGRPPGRPKRVRSADDHDSILSERAGWD